MRKLKCISGAIPTTGVVAHLLCIAEHCIPLLHSGDKVVWSKSFGKLLAMSRKL